MESQPPPDLQLLSQRVRLLGEALEAEEREIQRAKAPFGASGLWVTADGEHWTFHARRRDMPRAS